MARLVEMLMDIPPVSRVAAITAASLSLGTTLRVVNPFLFNLSWPAIVHRGQLWRLLTSFLYFGDFSIGVVFTTIQNIAYLKSLERETFTGRLTEFLLFLFFLWASILLISFAYPMFYTTTPFFTGVMYLWGRTNPDKLISFYGIITLQACYLPIVFIIITLWQKQSIVPLLIGVGLGHTFYFLYSICPRVYGVSPIQKLSRQVERLFRR
ncbi:Derlin-like protein [Giardia duodenalis assemblage B]|uniref:Derlin n=1 Tax=Giardia duodenalis assemblage B TaxID=1394984 RepID=A0A132NQ26_GIAIN|nr:Derlin-like protein [Giardia intestinalis assemblage B]